MHDTGDSGAGTWRGEFIRGVRDILPIAAATAPLGIIFGALSVKEGLTGAETLSLSALVFAGVSQFATIELWAHPLPFWTIFLTTVAINFRHVLYSAALGRRIAHWPPLARYVGFAFLVDTNFAMAELRGGTRTPMSYFAGLSVPLYLTWTGTTLLGAIFGALVTRPEALGLDFVVTAYFLYLVAGFRHRRNSAAVIAASTLGSVATYLTLGPPWHFAGGAAPAIALAVLLAGRRHG